MIEVFFKENYSVAACDFQSYFYVIGISFSPVFSISVVLPHRRAPQNCISCIWAGSDSPLLPRCDCPQGWQPSEGLRSAERGWGKHQKDFFPTSEFYLC